MRLRKLMRKKVVSRSEAAQIIAVRRIFGRRPRNSQVRAAMLPAKAALAAAQAAEEVR